MIEGQRAVAFVFDALVADATFSSLVGGRIYRDQVPQAATFPAAIVSLVSATDANTLGANRIWSNALVDVHLVSKGTYGAINVAADRADLVLQNSGGQNGGAHVVELRREQVMAYVENESGIAFAHLISTYRSEAYALP